jgi:hypothetical protein
MSLRTVTPITRAGIVLTSLLAAADVAGETFPTDGRQAVVVRNGGGSPITVTLNIIPTVDGQPVTDRTVVVAAGDTTVIGPFPPSAYRNPTSGLAQITYSSVTSVDVAVVSLTPEA